MSVGVHFSIQENATWVDFAVIKNCVLNQLDEINFRPSIGGEQLDDLHGEVLALQLHQLAEDFDALQNDLGIGC